MEDTAPSTIFLHGDLDLHIIEARRLPNMDVLAKHLNRCFTACSPGSPRATKVHHHRPVVSSDAYVTLSVPQTTLARTFVLKNSPNPTWDQRFRIPLAHPAAELEFRVKDNDLFGAELIGKCKIPAQDVASGEPISGWFPIISPSTGKPPKPDTALHLELKFTPFEANPAYRSPAREVTGVYFPMRKGNKLRLYQDAHVGSTREVTLGGGGVHRRESCWEDLCSAILEAQKLIYIVGWSVFHKIKLIREPKTKRELPGGGDLTDLTLGDLLKYKSEEGVRVLLLVWDDKTSHEKFGVNTAGVMQTHDEETRRFFKHSSVTCVLAPRYASSKLSLIKQQVVGTLFTHHQKCVLVDTGAHYNNRTLTAFLGGIDLCDGRYDTPEHRLFHGLDTIFKDDFHNPTLGAGIKVPRQPWHDLHCRIDGPAAYDVLINFEQRWRKATKWREFGLRFRGKSHWQEDALIRIDRISWFLSPHLQVTKDNTTIPGDEPKTYLTEEKDPDNWHVQIFRSIDSGSLKGFPRTVEQCEAQNLITAKDLIIDKSIQMAYIQAIRSAQHFIYIENQYFLGSSFAWSSYKDAGADNLVPIELALKIAGKIRANERFAVYVVLPMWPEGNPQSEVMQEILFWQSRTMQMMYEIIARALKSMGMVDSHPQDYLNFYCLGNREELPEEMSATNGEKVSDSWNFRRFMIYVHAKGMIVDDEYVIVGSANINQRSMAGTKDTELAMGAYQPHHTWAAKNGHPHGQVYAYRMSLWAEHLGIEVDSLPDPKSLECVKTVNDIADDNWRRYTKPEFTLLQGHLLKYPLLVEADGRVSPLPGYEHFPDVGGKVIGAHSIKLPDALTT